MEEYIPETLWKSNYTYTCAVCGKKIKKGDWVTKVAESRGMTLRAVDTDDYGSGYIPNVGERIVHRDCGVYDAWTKYSAYLKAMNKEFKPKNIRLYSRVRE